MGRWGLKRVANRRDDALSAVGWDRLEHLLADHYRREGFQVEHVGTGATRSKFDGGVDLRLHRGDARLVVQIKHWNAYKVPHNDVHQLLGILQNEDATGGILVTSGEFTRAAIEAAGRKGLVQLVDGDDLRRMLGDVPLPAGGPDPATAQRVSWEEKMVRGVGERLVAAAEDRIRYGSGGRGDGARSRRGGGLLAAVVAGGLAPALAQLAAFGLFVLVIVLAGKFFIGRLVPMPAEPVLRQMQAREASRAVQPPVQIRSAGAGPSTPAMSTTDPVMEMREPTPAEREARRRRNAESMRILEESTPEM